MPKTLKTLLKQRTFVSPAQFRTVKYAIKHISIKMDHGQFRILFVSTVLMAFTYQTPPHVLNVQPTALIVRAHHFVLFVLQITLLSLSRMSVKYVNHVLFNACIARLKDA